MRLKRGRVRGELPEWVEDVEITAEHARLIADSIDWRDGAHKEWSDLAYRLEAANRYDEDDLEEMRHGHRHG